MLQLVAVLQNALIGLGGMCWLGICLQAAVLAPAQPLPLPIDELATKSVDALQFDQIPSWFVLSTSLWNGPDLDSLGVAISADDPIGVGITRSSQASAQSRALNRFSRWFLMLSLAMLATSIAWWPAVFTYRSKAYSLWYQELFGPEDEY